MFKLPDTVMKYDIQFKRVLVVDKILNKTWHD
jgi:hypothetical protein